MKRYELLKDLPFAKAGAIFKEWTGERDGTPEKTLVNENNITTNLWVKDMENFDEWFEEVKKLKKYYYIGSMGHVESAEYKGWELSVRLRKMMGNYFETYEETERHIDYLLAKEVIKEDAKGFEPDWNSLEQIHFYGFWDFQSKKPFYSSTFTRKEPTIYFETVEDIEESFKKHSKEWITYLTYEQ